jgi:hypothetical protein
VVDRCSRYSKNLDQQHNSLNRLQIQSDEWVAMTSFEDYHRTVIGYHGTGLSTALRIVSRISQFRQSSRDYDWLGKGVYFWEYAPKQAMDFARIRQRQYREKKNKTPYDIRRATEPLAVVACMIRLGFCLDLTESRNIEYLKEVFVGYEESMRLAGKELPKNTRKYRKLDCAVFEYAYAMIADSAPNSQVDTARGIFVPTDGNKRIWPGSWISDDTHIQICVRKTASLLGAWLHYPSKTGANDVCEAIQSDFSDLESENPEGNSESEANDYVEEN